MWSLLTILLTAACTSTGSVGVSDTPTPPRDTTTSSDTATGTTDRALRFDGAPPRNVLMISLDTMRRDHMSRYADDPTLTPFLDQLAAEGLVLDDLTGCSNWTVAGTACVMSGAGNLERAEARGMVPILVGMPVAALPKSDHPNGPTPMLPLWLRDAGYHSRLFTTNGFFSNTWGNAQGFDAITYPGPMGTPGIYARMQGDLDSDPPPEPWYLHIHLFEPHRPYTPPEEYLDALDELPPPPFELETVGQQNLAEALINNPPDWMTEEDLDNLVAHMRVRYAAEVRRFDDGLRDMWADLDARGLLDDALVVFWTDHGEALWEHGTTTAHAKLLHRNEADAIGLFWAKNIVPTAWSGPTRQADLVPTLLDALGLPMPPEVTGIPVGLAPDDRPRFALSDGAKGPVQSLRQGPWLMHFRWQGARPGLVELFDIEADPDTQVDLYDPAAPSDTARQLWELLEPKVRAAEPYIADDPRGWEISWPEELL